jgi:electron transport complex protein RnfD
MLNVLVALAPLTVFGIALYGLSALATVLVSIVCAAAAETAFRLLTKQKPRVKDCSALVTGLLLALVLPPQFPLWATALGAIFATVIVKEFFGGLGANVFNPALGARAFLLASFPALMTTWYKPGGFAATVDAVTTATPLAVLKHGLGDAGIGASVTELASFLSGGATAESAYTELLRELFFGNYAGCIGESSALLILAGAFYLLITRTIDWRAPVAMLASSAAFSALLGADPLVSLLSGGLLFGAFFMATDYTSAPVTEYGKLIFGAGAGLITVLIRKFGNYPEGVMYSILIMNAAVPYLDRLRHKKYGEKRKGKK